MPVPKYLFFHHIMHATIIFLHLNSVLQIPVLSLSSALSGARRAGLLDLVKHESKDRSALLLGACAVPHALTSAFWFNPTPCALWLDCAEHLIPNSRAGADMLNDGHQGLLQGRLLSGAAWWHGPPLHPFASGSISCKQYPGICEGEDEESLS